MPAASAPRASAVFASSDSAPKLMSLTNSGTSSTSGRAALGPITVRDPTVSVSSRGRRASCAVTNWMSSQLGSSSRDTPIDTIGPWWP